MLEISEIFDVKSFTAVRCQLVVRLCIPIRTGEIVSRCQSSDWHWHWQWCQCLPVTGSARAAGATVLLLPVLLLRVRALLQFQYSA